MVHSSYHSTAQRLWVVLARVCLAQIVANNGGKAFSLLGAVVQRHAAVAVAAQKKTGMPGSACFNSTYPLGVADVVLRNRAVPADDVVQNRGRLNAQGQAEVVANRLHQPLVVPAGDFSAVPAATHRS